MAVGELPYGPREVSTGIFGAIGRVLCADIVAIEDRDTPNLFLLMFDFRWQPQEIWEDIRPFTSWTDGRFHIVRDRPSVWRWEGLDHTGDPVKDMLYLDAEPDGDRVVTDGHRRMSDERLARLFPEGLALGQESGQDA